MKPMVRTLRSQLILFALISLAFSIVPIITTLTVDKSGLGQALFLIWYGLLPPLMIFLAGMLINRTETIPFLYVGKIWMGMGIWFALQLLFLKVKAGSLERARTLVEDRMKVLIEKEAAAATRDAELASWEKEVAAADAAALKASVAGLPNELAGLRREVDQLKAEAATAKALQAEVIQFKAELAQLRASAAPGDLPFWMRGKKK